MIELAGIDKNNADDTGVCPLLVCHYHTIMQQAASWQTVNH